MLRAIKANALYGGGYPLFTALGRPLIGKLAVEVAREQGCDTIAHGCTGKGNDQVRIEATISTLDPELRIIAPVREWQMGREEEIAYAREQGIPVKGGTEVSPYSIDDNLWGRSSEGREIEDLDEAPPDDVFQLVTRPEEAPNEPQILAVGFERGRPVSLDGEQSGLGGAARAGGRDRRSATASGSSTTSRTGWWGSRSETSMRCRPRRSCWRAHRELEKLVCTIHQNNFKGVLESHWAYLCYAGLWLEPLRHDLDAYMDSVNEFVTGEVSLKLYRGSVTPVRRNSPYALYDRSLASSASPGETSPSMRAPGSSSSSRCRAGWPTGSERRTSDLRVDRPDRGAGAQAALRTRDPDRGRRRCGTDRRSVSAPTSPRAGDERGEGAPGAL